MCSDEREGEKSITLMNDRVIIRGMQPVLMGQRFGTHSILVPRVLQVDYNNKASVLDDQIKRTV